MFFSRAGQTHESIRVLEDFVSCQATWVIVKDGIQEVALLAWKTRLGVFSRANREMPSGLLAQVGRFFTFPRKSTAADGEKQISGVSIGSQISQAGGMTKLLYISHGAPTLPVEFDDPTRKFLVDLPTKIEKPKAIVVVSAHWDTVEPTVTAMRTNDTIHDFYGFQRELYELRYDAPGDLDLAQRVVELLQQGGFPKATKDGKRGLDHGAWIPLLLMYPDKNVPVVQLSIQCRKNGAHHYKLGQALAPLKSEGVLIICSGTTTHNLRMLDRGARKAEPWAVAFDNWLTDAFLHNRHEDIMNYLEKAPHARKAHPSPDHFLPAIVAIGAAGDKSVAKQIHSAFAFGCMSMSAFAFEDPLPAALAA